MREIFRTVRSLIGAVILIIVLLMLGAMINAYSGKYQGLHKPSLLVLDLSGVIIDGKKFLEDLREYRDEKNIKGIIVRVDSPGGVVGPSQEIFAELKRVRDELKKPVVISCGSMAASGAYYAAVAGDRIITNPGTLMGSIGVIMEFANLEKLYDWAKIQRYAIKTGPYKDSGAEYRPMTADEKALFQDLIDRVHAQFKEAVEKGRKLSREVVDKYSDGRVFTGETAVKLGFADQVGTFEDAVRIAGELSGLGKKPTLFEPPEEKPSFLEIIGSMEESAQLKKITQQVLPQQELLAKPLYLLPGTAGL